MLRLFALGLLATIMGVGSLVNGSIGSGIALILIGVGVGGYPGFRYFTSQRASWRMTASLRERSPAADDGSSDLMGLRVSDVRRRVG